MKDNYNCEKSGYLAKFFRVGKITCWKCGGGGGGGGAGMGALLNIKLQQK